MSPIPAITSTAAPSAVSEIRSPRSSQDDDIPKTGTSREYGATAEASYLFSR